VIPFPTWLVLREPADAAARSRGLVELLRPHVESPLTVHDLGSGTGSMGRWLAPLLPVQQRWVLHDLDRGLLATAAADPPAGVEVQTRVDDVTAPAAGALAGAGLVTSSALLDILTADELVGVVDACVATGAPVLFTLDVTGEVELDPADPLDPDLGAAFDDHQRREARGSRLLGPDAPSLVASALRAHGYDVHAAASPWRLDAGMGELVSAWLDGWVAAATEQRPELTAPAHEWRTARATHLAEGTLAVTVHHEDILAVPRPRG
jgi:hypothetical protein